MEYDEGMRDGGLYLFVFIIAVAFQNCACTLP